MKFKNSARPKQFRRRFAPKLKNIKDVRIKGELPVALNSMALEARKHQ